MQKESEALKLGIQASFLDKKSASELLDEQDCAQALIGNIDTLRFNHQTLSKSHIRQQEINIQLRHDIVKLDSELEKAEKAQEHHDVEKAAIHQQVSVLAQQLSQRRTSYDELRIVYDKLKGDFQQQERSIASLQQSNKKYRKKTKSLIKKIRHRLSLYAALCFLGRLCMSAVTCIVKTCYRMIIAIPYSVFYCIRSVRFMRWNSIKKSPPLVSGMFVVSDGKNQYLLHYNANNKQFAKGRMSFIYWRSINKA